MNNDDFPTLWTIEETGKNVPGGPSANKLYELIRRGELPPGVLVKVSDVRGNRINLSRYKEWLAQGGLAQRKAA